MPSQFEIDRENEKERAYLLRALDQFKSRIIIVHKKITYAPKITEIMITEVGSRPFITLFIEGDFYG